MQQAARSILIGASCPQAIGATNAARWTSLQRSGSRGGQRDGGYLCRGDGGRGRGVGVVVAAVAVAFLLAGCGRRRDRQRHRGWKASRLMNTTHARLL